MNMKAPNIKFYLNINWFLFLLSPPNRIENTRRRQIHKGTGRVISTSSQSSYSNSWKNSPPKNSHYQCNLTKQILPVVLVILFGALIMLPAPRVGVETWIFILKLVLISMIYFWQVTTARTWILPLIKIQGQCQRLCAFRTLPIFSVESAWFSRLQYSHVKFL